MCELTEGFKFCTCTDLDPAKNKAEYTWYLSRFLGLDDMGAMGSIVGPSDDLGRGITIPMVLHILNGGEGFDFAYTPANQDCLRISRSVKGEFFQYMSFLYKDGSWQEGMNPPFSTRSEAIAKGNLFKD